MKYRVKRASLAVILLSLILCQSGRAATEIQHELFLRAKEALEQGQYEEAISSFSFLITHMSDTSSFEREAYRTALGDAYQGNEQYSEAINAYLEAKEGLKQLVSESAILAYSGLIQNNEKLAFCYQKMGDQKLATEVLAENGNLQILLEEAKGNVDTTSFRFRLVYAAQKNKIWLCLGGLSILLFVGVAIYGKNLRRSN